MSRCSMTKLPHTLPEQTKMRQNWLLFFPASDILLTNHFFITQPALPENMDTRSRPSPMAPSRKISKETLSKCGSLFISKSIGTAISSAYAFRHNLKVKSILFTPLAETFSFPLQGSIAFHGTADPWAETDSVQALAAQKEVPLFLTKNANHSLENGDVQTDLSILKTTMDRVERFIINP